MCHSEHSEESKASIPQPNPVMPIAEPPLPTGEGVPPNSRAHPVFLSPSVTLSAMKNQEPLLRTDARPKPVGRGAPHRFCEFDCTPPET